jgi:hypothetical protein
MLVFDGPPWLYAMTSAPFLSPLVSRSISITRSSTMLATLIPTARSTAFWHSARAWW